MIPDDIVIDILSKHLGGLADRPSFQRAVLRWNIDNISPIQAIQDSMVGINPNNPHRDKFNKALKDLQAAEHQIKLDLIENAMNL